MRFEVRDILEEHCVCRDDMLKREGYTCYTIQKKAWNGKHYKAVKKKFKNIGYKPIIQDECDDFVTYMIPNLSIFS